jgi:hypothetical protein
MLSERYVTKVEAFSQLISLHANECIANFVLRDAGC